MSEPRLYLYRIEFNRLDAIYGDNAVKAIWEIFPHANRARWILIWLDMRKGRTRAEIAKIFGISRGRVEQIQKRMIHYLKHPDRQKKYGIHNTE